MYKKLDDNAKLMILETGIDEFAERGRTDPLFRELARIVAANGGLWCAEAEAYLLTHAKKLED